MFVTLPGESMPRTVEAVRELPDGRIEATTSAPGCILIGGSRRRANVVRSVLTVAFPDWKVELVRSFPASASFRALRRDPALVALLTAAENTG